MNFYINPLSHPYSLKTLYRLGPGDTAKMRRYTQYYEYDAVGNFIQMRHTVVGGTGNWTRYYTTDPNSNRMAETVVGSGTPETYVYDNRGNITGGFAHLLSMEYNASNRLEMVELDSSRKAYYQYDGSGQRVRKSIIDVSTGNVIEGRIYVGEWETYRKYDTNGTVTLERETLHISDDTGRIALIDTRTTGSGIEPAQLMRYQYSNQQSTATLELDDAGAIISYEEFYPYGSTSFRSGRSGAEVSLKRYRYTGKERDEESGLYYHGARYYIPWLARWTASDPINNEWYNLEHGNPNRNDERSFVELAASGYEYCYDNPIRFTDPTGEQAPPTQEQKPDVDIPDEKKADFKKSAMGAMAVKLAIQRGDQVVLEQTFHIFGNKNVTQHSETLNEGKEGGGLLTVHQSGYLNQSGEPNWPGGYWQERYSGKAGRAPTDGETTRTGKTDNITPLTPAPMRLLPVQFPTAVPIPVPRPPVPPPPPPRPVPPPLLVFANPGWATNRTGLADEQVTFAFNVAARYRPTSATVLNVTINIAPNLMTQAGAVDANGLEGFNTRTNRPSFLNANTQRPYTNTQTHLQNIMGQGNNFAQLLRRLLPGVRINVSFNTSAPNGNINIAAPRPAPVVRPRR